jgi:transcriptional regulator with XRE-family HTH domain
MTPDRFRFLLDQADWTVNDFGRATGVERRTVARWLSGEAPIPGTVSAIMGLVAMRGLSPAEVLDATQFADEA